MLARDLLELATLAAMHGPVLADGGLSLPPQGMERYWSTSKCRLDRWGRTLKQIAGRGFESLEPSSPSRSDVVRGVVEEILASEVLTRVWTAVIAAHDRRCPGADALVVARSVLLGQQEARYRALSLLVSGPLVNSREAVDLNRLRAHAERWTDLLIGQLCTQDDVSEFAADPARARQFGADFRLQGAPVRSLVWASLRASVASDFTVPSPNPDLNSQIASSILACFQPELFDSTGLLRSRWMARLWTTTAETQVLLDEFFAYDLPDAADMAATTPPSADVYLRRRRIG